MPSDTVSAVIAAASAVIALLSAIIVFYQTKKEWYISIIAPQRLEWADKLRNAVADFASAFYKGEDLRGPKDKIALYLTPSNARHTPLIKAIDAVCCGRKDDVSEVIAETQKLLRWNWWIVKSESTISLRAEVQRDKKVQMRAEWHEQNAKTKK